MSRGGIDMDRKVVSFIVLAGLLGTLITFGVLFLLYSPASAEGASARPPGGATSVGAEQVVLKLSHVLETGREIFKILPVSPPPCSISPLKRAAN
ncbi:hypothetical protein [Sorangium sp. So ce1151]|uniref:hypothetical protein n=1 Tax=Sorangium sp. So ce1151 TaxID=3133332 RepID=UPI003F62FE8E